MRVRAVVTFVSGALIALFLVLFALPVHATPAGGPQVACGNGWTIAQLPAKSAPIVGPDGPESVSGTQPLAEGQACDRARGVRKAAGVLALGLGVVGLCGVYLSRRSTRANRT
jgi:hypothetical protein